MLGKLVNNSSSGVSKPWLRGQMQPTVSLNAACGKIPPSGTQIGFDILHIVSDTLLYVKLFKFEM